LLHRNKTGLTGRETDLRVLLVKETAMSKETTSTIPPKSEPTANPFTAGFDPFAAWQASQQAFHKMMSDAQGRAQAFADEYAALESQMYARAKQAIDTWAQLAQDAITYSSQLSAQARKLGLETARKMSV
jgi:hypothetical protein